MIRDPLPPREEPAIVTTSHLSRSPRTVLDRVARGERLLVSCHGRPVATLQPLDGVVVQPFTGGAHDIFGWPAGGALAEADKLTEIQRALLTHGVVRRIRVAPTRLWGPFEEAEVADCVRQIQVEGIAKRTSRGLELTARGMALREALGRRDGLDPDEI